jgi:hypothetical protein
MANGFKGAALPLDADGFQRALGVINTGAAELWAVIGVETTGCGFLADRRPKILFERHIFSKETQGKFDAPNPDLSNGTPGGYAGGAAEYQRLERAIALDRQAALTSTSWGIGQVMGFNATVVGYSDVDQMVRDMMASEANQMGAMARFIAANKLDASLRTHDWPSFARDYNGANYSINSYDTRLSASYQRFLYGVLPDLTVRAAQILLLYLGYQPGAIDGVMGRMTRSAMNAFQASAGLAATDLVDAHTAAALRTAAGL